MRCLPVMSDRPCGKRCISENGELSGPMDERLAQAGEHRKVIAALSHFPAAYFYAIAYGLERSPLPLSSPDFEVSLAWQIRSDVDPAHIWFREIVGKAVEVLYDEAHAPSQKQTLRRQPSVHSQKSRKP
jgi:DNA-binding transcriptional LysR family regulator